VKATKLLICQATTRVLNKARRVTTWKRKQKEVASTDTIINMSVKKLLWKSFWQINTSMGIASTSTKAIMIISMNINMITRIMNANTRMGRSMIISMSIKNANTNMGKIMNINTIMIMIMITIMI
jgi:hypothetical protein